MGQSPKSQNECKLTYNKGLQKNDDFAVRKNKPNSNPISEKAKMNVNIFATKDYENETAWMGISFGGSPTMVFYE